MIFLFKDSELKFSASIVWELSKIYGIGFEKASYVASLIGINFFLAVCNLNYYKFEALSFIIKVFYCTDDRLKTLKRQRLNYFLILKLRKGIRFFKGLPIRGQRTHSNSKQSKYHKKGEI